MKINKDIVEYLMVPLTSSFGFARLRCVMLKKGCLITDSNFFNPLLMIKRFSKHNINCISGVPSAFAMLTSLPIKFLKDIKKKLIWAEIGSAAIEAKHKTKLLRLFPKSKIVSHYGLTEASRSTLQFLNKRNKKINLIGRQSPGVKISICDDLKKTITKKNIVGEITIEGENVAKGYCNFSSKDFKNGKFYSGDLGSIDENGYIYFFGRKDEMMNISGIKISPIFLENIIQKKLKLKFDFAIYTSPKKHEIYGEKIAIYLKKKINLKNIIHKINKILYKNGAPNEGKIRDVVYIDKFPFTHTGKIKRKNLKNYIKKVENVA